MITFSFTLPSPSVYLPRFHYLFVTLALHFYPYFIYGINFFVQFIILLLYNSIFLCLHFVCLCTHRALTYPPTYLSNRLPTHFPPTHPSTCQRTYPPPYLSSTYPFIYLPTYLTTNVPTHLPTNLLTYQRTFSKDQCLL
jgi:hypothetical protein